MNGQFAKLYWPGAEAVGKHSRLDSRAGTPVEIIGVAETIKYRSASEKPLDFVYLPLAQHPIARMLLLLRSSGDPLQLVKPGKDVVRVRRKDSLGWDGAAGQDLLKRLEKSMDRREA